MSAQPVVAVWDALRAHLRAHDLPELYSANVTQRSASLHLHQESEPVVAAALLTWADTLDSPTAKVWRSEQPGPYDWVHLAVTGGVPGIAVVRVFGTTPFTDRGLGSGLVPGTGVAVSLSALRAAAGGAS